MTIRTLYTQTSDVTIIVSTHTSLIIISQYQPIIVYILYNNNL